MFAAGVVIDVVVVGVVNDVDVAVVSESVVVVVVVVPMLFMLLLLLLLLWWLFVVDVGVDVVWLML